MKPANVKTPGRGNGAGAGEAGEVGNLKTDRTAHGAVIVGRGYRAYEHAKTRLPQLAPDDYRTACREIAKAMGI